MSLTFDHSSIHDDTFVWLVYIGESVDNGFLHPGVTPTMAFFTGYDTFRVRYPINYTGYDTQRKKIPRVSHPWGVILRKKKRVSHPGIFGPH